MTRMLQAPNEVISRVGGGAGAARSCRPYHSAQQAQPSAPQNDFRLRLHFSHHLAVYPLDFRDDELSISPKGGRSLAGGASLARRDRCARNLVELPDQTLTIAGEF